MNVETGTEAGNSQKRNTKMGFSLQCSSGRLQGSQIRRKKLMAETMSMAVMVVSQQNKWLGPVSNGLQ
jgi:hypothetical protein